MNSTKTKNEYIDDGYETETIVQERIVEVSKKPIEETLAEYEVELDISKYPKTKAKRRVVAHVSLKS